MATRIVIKQADITNEDVDAIVNAANHTLLGGGGVDGAIHYAAGQELLEECKGLKGCNTGEAKITKGYNLPAKFIIHTVGPIYFSENENKAELLANCYENSLQVALQNGLRSVAFPAISTGAFGFPKYDAALIAINTVGDFIADNPDAFDEIRFILFSEDDKKIYESIHPY